MELFKNANFDFLGKKWPFIIASLLLTAAGVVSLIVKGGPKYGIDFAGGVNMYVKFAQTPPVEKLRSALSQKIPGEISVVEIPGTQEVIIGVEQKQEKDLDSARRLVVETLAANFGQTGGKLDLHNTGAGELAARLRDPLQRASVGLSDQQLADLAKAIMNFRDGGPNFGILSSLDQLSAVPGVTPAILNVIKQEVALSPFAIRSVEIVGPKIGAELRNQAILATLYALAGMLVYIAFRFETIYGVAAVIAVFHDTIITIGLFSIFNKEISLTVVAALLTLVGYSMNDTIVVFDRIRENLKLMRREKFPNLVNLSINQTLSRTVLTSGLTFLSAFALWLFGGQVLNGFAFALVVGIIVGTYSSIFIASPILIFWKDWTERRSRRTSGDSGSAVAEKRAAGREPMKAVK
ncbi:MAG: protein translocase subunit SecF [Bryobacteraceae bacterium]|nr:protein translocase subunit SecF [Bryobacteraceae bacterium]MDW8377525.1 protein translocase subunit SecF [Bryobacterales bacterium]